MIGLLQGTLFYKNDSSIIVMVNGVGYKVEAVSRLLAIPEGDEVLTYVYTYVREDAIKLFGFSSEEELRVFEMLLSVSGIGPKGAMSIVSILGTEGIYTAIAEEDAKAFKSVSGIGTKNAEKIVIELKSKIKHTEHAAGRKGPAAYKQREELQAALLSLGYSLAEIKNVETSITQSDNLSEMVRSALQLLNKI